MLFAENDSNPTDEAYQRNADEIIRGIYMVSGLRARLDIPGWIAVEADSAGMADWIVDKALQENVQYRASGIEVFFVPCGTSYAVDKEVKSVITVAAKTTHYYQDHAQREIKNAFAVEQVIEKVTRLFRKKK
jgi:hypothetical protein